MKKIIISVIYIAVLFLCLRQGLNYFYNEHVLERYNAEDYSINENLLLTANIIQPYIVHYNNGNIHYMNSQYEEAIEDYNKALEFSIPEKRECSVRINLALAMVKSLGDNYKEPDNIPHSLEVLYDARDVLLEDGCATEDGRGHSNRAERLKRDIEAAIEELENLEEQENPEEPEQTDPSESSESQGSSESSENGESSEQSGSSESSESSEEPGQSESSEGGDGSESSMGSFEAYESSIQSQMQEEQQRAYQQRQEDLQQYAEYNRDWNTDYENIW